jgi:hemerythrin
MTTPNTPMQWSDQLQLGYPPMDHTHQAFVEHVAAVQASPDADLPRHMQALLEHLQTHFEEENNWMRDNQFPAMDCHINEHAAVLKSAQEVYALLLQGDASHCQTLAAELQKWFPGHADYLDSALSHWMCKLRLGGKPVLIKRNVATPTSAISDAS